MKFDCALFALALIVAAVARSMAKAQREILFGVNYVPFVTCVEDFGPPNIEGRNTDQAEMVGYYYGDCPAVLYIAGFDNKGTEIAGYDLIGRIWGKDQKY